MPAAPASGGGPAAEPPGQEVAGSNSEPDCVGCKCVMIHRQLPVQAAGSATHAANLPCFLQGQAPKSASGHVVGVAGKSACAIGAAVPS
eukprot:358848-Chlamydomonas_euryale.AAC.14